MFVKNTYYLFALIAILIVSGCASKERLSKRYINNDSTSIYSTHINRPFKYGYALKNEEVNEFHEYKIKYFGVKNGETIAEIGAASGWLQAINSIYTDSVTYYIEDIDSNYANTAQMNKAVAYYSAMRTKPQTNTFKFVLGNKLQTNLPSNTFDIVILSNTFHEIKHKENIIKEIDRILKPNGRLVICETFSNEFHKTRNPGCEIRSYKVSDIIELFSKYEYYLSKTEMPESAFYNFLTFEKGKIHNEAFCKKKESIDYIIQNLNKLNNKNIANDEEYCHQIADELKASLNEYNNVYSNLNRYLTELANYFTEHWDYNEAINIYNINETIFPKDRNTAYYLAKLQIEMYNFNDAISNYQKYIQSDTSNQRLKEITLNAVTELTDKSKSSDSILVKKQVDFLRPNLKEIEEKIISVEDLIECIGKNWELDGEYNMAFNVFKANVLLFPNSAEAYKNLGVVYTDIYQPEIAIDLFTKALALDTKLQDAKWRIRKARKMIKKANK